MEPPPGAAENSKLRHVEKDVLIPQIMRERAKELCSDKVQEYWTVTLQSRVSPLLLTPNCSYIPGRNLELFEVPERESYLCTGNCGKCVDNIGNKAILQRPAWFGIIAVHGSNIHDKSTDLAKLLKMEQQDCFFCSFFDEIQVLSCAFTKCCQETGLLMVVKCRQENTALKDCLVGYYSDPLFYEECKTEYLKQREEYRATGIKKKRQKFTSNV